jgi:hypothetical protein
LGGGEQLLTGNVFIDTSEFYRLQFDVAGNILSRLATYAHQGWIHFYTTWVTRQEIRANVSELVKKANAARRNFQHQASILKRLREYQTLFIDGNEVEETEKILAQIDEYFKRVKAFEVSLRNVSSQAIFERYFMADPPFGPGKSKSEFPDAFVLQVLENWCKDNTASMYVVSGDLAMKAFCEHSECLHYLPTTQKFLDLVTRFNEDEASSVASKAFKLNEEKVRKSIESTFKSWGFYLKDQVGEDVEIEFVDSMELGEPDLLEVSPGEALFALEFTINFTANLAFDDPDSGIWDSEEKVMLFVETAHETIEETLDLEAEIRLRCDPSHPEQAQVKCESINNGKDIGLESGR